jgi:uncharacterized delta-60 repeat protein
VIVGLLLPGFAAFAQFGRVDTSFNPGGGQNSGFDSDVFSIAVQPDGKLVAGGIFTKFDRTSRNSVARLNPDGSLDTGFNPGTGANNLVEILALQPDGKVVLCGRFSVFNGVARPYVARLNSNGSLDTSFTPTPNAIVLGIALQADGKAVIGGLFTSVNGVTRNYVARLNTDGSVDSSFDPGSGPNLPVHTVAVQPDSKIIIGGQFTSVSGSSRIRIARLNPNGSLDTSFDPGAGADLTVVTTAVQPDGKILAGGDFTNVVNATRYYVARLNMNGSLDTGFDANIALAFGGVLALQPQVDGKIIVAGEFDTVGGVPRKNIVRVNPSGVVDPTFDPGAGPGAGSPQLDRIRGVAIQPDGRIVVGGGFTSFDGAKLNYIARLLGDQGGAVEFTTNNFNVDEAAGTAVIEILRTGGSAGPVSVNCVTSDGTAVAGSDYAAANVVVYFDAGEIRKPIAVPVLWDSQVEGNETVQLVLGSPTGGVILGAQRTATLTILDNTNSASLRFTAITPTNNQMRLTLSGPAGRPYVLQGSTNSSAWSSLGTNTPSGTTFDYLDTTAAGLEHRFYRAFNP